jgi:hypothetical protein
MTAQFPEVSSVVPIPYFAFGKTSTLTGPDEPGAILI